MLHLSQNRPWRKPLVNGLRFPVRIRRAVMFYHRRGKLELRDQSHIPYSSFWNYFDLKLTSQPLQPDCLPTVSSNTCPGFGRAPLIQNRGILAHVPDVHYAGCQRLRTDRPVATAFDSLWQDYICAPRSSRHAKPKLQAHKPQA